MKTYLPLTHRVRPAKAQLARRSVESHSLLLAAMLAAGSLSAMAQNETAAPATAETVPAAEPTTTSGQPAAIEATGADGAAMNTISTNGGLRMNFRNAPIDMVLNHLSEAAGFIIELDTRISGNISVISAQPMSKDDAVDLLNSQLNRNGYAAIRRGERTLKIMDIAKAKLSNPVRIGNEPESIPNNDEMVTQIIPIRYVEAGQLVSDISPFVSSGATIIANQAGNSIIITDTQSNIRHLVEIIKAIDSSAEDVTVVRVFRLQHADPTEMATLLSGLFPDQTGATQSPFRVANRGGGNRGGNRGGGFNPFAAAFGGAANASAGGQTDRIKKRNQVLAVADARTSSVVVTATQDLMEQIEEMVTQLDNPGKKQTMHVIRLNNADPSSVLTVLQDTVGATTSRNNRNQVSPFQNRIQQNQNSMNSSSSGFGTTGGAGGRNTGVGGR